MKKIAPYIFIVLILLTGLFGSAPVVQAQTATIVGNCTVTNPSGTPPTTVTTGMDEATCNGMPGFISWTPASAGAPSPAPTTTNSSFAKALEDKSCFLGVTSGFISVPGCLVQLSYYIFFMFPSFLLWMAAHFFNVLISITLSSKMLQSGFISTAWVVVRDLSNIFFILILLYIAIKIILDMGGHEAKKMIAHVVIMALLINFSMFVTEVVIDTSNILARIFYSKISVVRETPGKPSTAPAYDPVTGEKDISGALMSAFDPSQTLSADFFQAAEQVTVPGFPPVQGEVPAGILIGVIVVTGAIMLFAAYAFFIAGLSFVGRLIELFVLIVFSPFAFMSFSIPILGRLEYIGWDAWSHRLIKTAFMAPIFMFMLYFIFRIVKADVFSDLVRPGSQGMIVRLLSLMIPAMVILVLLMKATEFAKKGAGHFGEMLIKGGKLGAGIALGAATGGAAIVGSGTLGALASRAASSEFLNKRQKETGAAGFASRLALRSADYGAQASFDLRKTPGVTALAKAGGIDLEKAKVIGLGSQEGGYEKRRAEKVRKRQERAKEIEVREDEEIKQNLNKLEQDKESLLTTYHHDIEMLDNRIKGARERSKDLASKANLSGDQADKDAAKKAADTLEELVAHKKAIKNGSSFTETELTANPNRGARGTVSYSSAKINGRSINDLEDYAIPHAHHAVDAEVNARKRAYADRVEKFSTNITLGDKTYYIGSRANREAAHKIRMKAKVPNKPSKGGGGDHGGGGGHDDHGGGDHGGGHGDGGGTPAATTHTEPAHDAGHDTHGAAPAAHPH